MLTESEFEPWFRLLETPGVGRETARRLLAACGSASAVFDTPTPTLRSLVGPAVTTALGQSSSALAPRWDVARRWLSGGTDRHVLALGDPQYPAALLNTADPPVLLYLQGQCAALQEPGLAMVGSRNATPQGLDNARAFACHLAEQGWLVVSGLAAGIDAAAHEGALAARSHPATPHPSLTLAVVGTGLDRVYPPRNRDLAARIAQQGLLVSEYPPGTPALPEHFPQRNRIIAGLCQGTLVVEAALQSGSLITARLANEAGREVFAIPGSIHSPHVKGCHLLIRQGAKLVETAQDILEELMPSLRPVQRALFTESASASATKGSKGAGRNKSSDSDSIDDTPHAEQALLDALGHDPVTTDALGQRTGWSAAELATKLLELELQGLVSRLPGGLYQRRLAG